MSNDMVRSAIFDGALPGRTAGVTESGRLQVDGLEAVAETEISTYTGAVGTTSSQLVAAQSSRIQLQLQNLDAAKSIHIRLGGDDATTDDLRIGPGVIWSVPGGVAYTGPIQAIGSDVDVNYVLLAFFRPSS